MSSVIERILCCCCGGNSLHPKSIVINGNNYKILEVIGEGGFGYVYKAQDLSFGGGRRGNRSGGGGGLVIANSSSRSKAGDTQNSLKNKAATTLLRLSNSQHSSHAAVGGDADQPLNSAREDDEQQHHHNANGVVVVVGDDDNDEDRSSSFRASAVLRDDHVAIKRFILTDGASLDERVRILSEADNHRAASATYHRNIVRFLDSQVIGGGGGGGGRSGAADASHSINTSNTQHNSSARAGQGLTRSLDGSAEVWVVMELCRGGSLQDAVNYNLKNGGQFGANEVLGIVLQCAAAVAHLHQGVPVTALSSSSSPPLPASTTTAACLPMAHWDIKLDNFLIAEVPLKTTADVANPSKRGGGGGKGDATTVNDHGSVKAATNNNLLVSAKSFASSSMGIGAGDYGFRYTIKLCDFGASTTKFLTPKTAKEVAAAEAELDSIMTTSYRAPETLDLWEIKRFNESSPPPSVFQSIDTKADVWSLGVVIYVLLLQEMPFDDTKASVMNGVPKWTVPLPMWKRMDAKIDIKARLLAIVIDEMLVKDPRRRADMPRVATLLRALAEEAGYDNTYL